MATQIHPTAIVDPGAELGEGTVVGPYCVIGNGVILGHDCRLHNHVTLAGPSEIGPRNEFFPYASLGQRSQDLKYVGEPTFLQIGEGNVFREFCTVNRGTAPGSFTKIGDQGNFLAYTHIAHDCTVGDHVIVEDYAIIGGLTAVHQFCRIGAHVITGGCSKVVQDVPPFMVADGNPAKVRAINTVGLKRRGYTEETIQEIKKAFRILYREQRNTSESIAELEALPERSTEIDYLIAFVKTSERGIA
jgi:UDP-N-acetylglucosamine acyltransferase